MLQATTRFTWCGQSTGVTTVVASCPPSSAMSLSSSTLCRGTALRPGCFGYRLHASRTYPTLDHYSMTSSSTARYCPGSSGPLQSTLAGPRGLCCHTFSLITKRGDVKTTAAHHFESKLTLFFVKLCRHVTLTSLISHHKQRSSFEEFATLAYSPAPLTNLFVADPSVNSGNSSSRLAAPPPPAPSWGGGALAATAATTSITRADPEAAAASAATEPQTSPRNLKKLTANIKATLQGHPTTQKRASVSGFEQVSSSQILNTNNNHHQTSGSSPSAAINQAVSQAVNLHSRLKRN